MKKYLIAALLVLLIPSFIIEGCYIGTRSKAAPVENAATITKPSLSKIVLSQKDGERVLSSVEFDKGRIEVVAVSTTLVVLDDNKTEISNDLIDSGVVRVSYNTGNEKIAKIMIEKDGKKYVYGLRHDGMPESFPLQMGNGDYTITILENITDNKYTVVRKETVNLNLTDDKKVYTASIQNINWSTTSKAVLKAAELTKDCRTDKEKIDVLYNYMVKNYTYDYEKLKNLKTDYIPDPDRTLGERKGICYDYSSLLAAMLRSQGIPAKLVKGYTDNVDGYHAWNSIYLSDEDKWVTVDATYDTAFYEAKRKYIMVKDDAIYRPVNVY